MTPGQEAGGQGSLEARSPVAIAQAPQAEEQVFVCCGIVTLGLLFDELDVFQQLVHRAFHGVLHGVACLLFPRRPPDVAQVRVFAEG